MAQTNASISVRVILLLLLLLRRRNNANNPGECVHEPQMVMQTAVMSVKEVARVVTRSEPRRDTPSTWLSPSFRTYGVETNYESNIYLI